MKKGLIALLCASVAAAIMVAIPAKHISNEAAVREEPTVQPTEVELKPGPLVTDPEEIKKLAEELNLEQDGEELGFIQVYDFVYPSEEESTPANDHATDSESK